MRLKRYMMKEEKMSGKKLEKSMIGYQVDFSSIKKISDYLESLLIINNVRYKQNTNPHITIAQIVGKYPKDKIIRTMQQLPANYDMKPKQLKLLYGENTKKYYITIEMKKTDKYIKAHDITRNELPKIMTFPDGMKPHISLFVLNNINNNTWEEINENLKLPKIKVNKVQLFNNKFLPEFLLKK